MTEKSKIKRLKFTDIRLDTDGMTNCRLELGDISDLVESIKKEGLLQNLGVWQPSGKDYYVLTLGFRRYAAITEIRKENPDFMNEVDCTVVEGNLAKAQVVNLVENIKRKNLNSGDLASRLYHMYDKGGLKEAEVAKLVDLSQQHVASLIAVHMQCIPAVLRALRKDWITLTTAKKLSRFPADKQAEALENLLNTEQAGALDKWLADKEGGSKKPGFAVLRQKLKQIEVYSSDLDVDFRKGVTVGILYSMGLISKEQDLMHVPAGTALLQAPAVKGRGKSLKTLQKEKEEAGSAKPTKAPRKEAVATE